MIRQTTQLLSAALLTTLASMVASAALAAQVAGGFGVGTTTPNAALHVLRDDGLAQVLVEEVSATPGSRVLFKLSNNGPTRFQIENTVGGGSLRFNFALNNGGDFVIDEPGDAQNPEFLFEKDGDLTILGTLTDVSDVRLKRDVAPLGDVLGKLQGIRGVSYHFADGLGPAGQHVGLLAQELQPLFPALVHEDSQGRLSIAYGKFTAVLLEAIKEQQRENDDLRARVARLEAAMAGTHR